MGDSESEPPVAKRPKLAENNEEEENSAAKIFLCLDAVQDKLLQHQEVLDQKIALLKMKMREASMPLYAERQRLAAKVPNFWFKAIQGHPTVGEILTPLDRKIFAYLVELDVQESTDPRDDWFSINFLFKENEYFENGSLWKKFRRKMEEGELKTFITTSGVKLKPGKAKEVQRNETILNWFSADDMDTELGEVFRTEIWAHPLVLDAYDDGDQEEEEPLAMSEPKSTPVAPEADPDMESAIALAAAWADSDSE